MIGIDEVGRGAWAGPLVMAAVRFKGTFPEGLNDSKKLGKAVREKLALAVVEEAEWATVFYDVSLVDSLGLTECLKRGALRLVQSFSTRESVIIDGNYNFLAGSEYEKLGTTVVKADALYPEVMAASIIAKVARDSYMTYLHQLNKFKGYSFDAHVGYGTQKHHDALKEFGVSSVHRVSFKPIQFLKGVNSVIN